MKPKYKERLVRCRQSMIRAMDVTVIMKELRSDNVLSKGDEDNILQVSLQTAPGLTKPHLRIPRPTTVIY